jgi:hypothetical protein
VDVHQLLAENGDASIHVRSADRRAQDTVFLLNQRNIGFFKASKMNSIGKPIKTRLNAWLDKKINEREHVHREPRHRGDEQRRAAPDAAVALQKNS